MVAFKTADLELQQEGFYAYTHWGRGGLTWQVHCEFVESF